MALTIQPIETQFMGFRFRSRLEARWGVWFSEMSIPFDYEPEGFKLSNGKHYLPDFRIPSWDTWIEIKPDVPAAYIEGGNVAERFAQDRIGRMLLVIGDPWEDGYRIQDHIGSGQPETIFSRFAECRRCDGICLLGDNEWDAGYSELGTHTCGDHEKWPLHSREGSPRIFAAYRAARGARFEHGESGTRR